MTNIKIEFKALPGIKLRVVPDGTYGGDHGCAECTLRNVRGVNACGDHLDGVEINCADGEYYFKEIK